METRQERTINSHGEQKVFVKLCSKSKWTKGLNRNKAKDYGTMKRQDKSELLVHMEVLVMQSFKS